MTSPRLDPGSFRDRESRVLHHEGRIFRVLRPSAAEAWRHLVESSFFSRRMAEGRIVGTREADLAALGLDGGPWVAALEHDPIPFLSYPYEWSFSMLQDAALLHLELLLAALDEGLVLKDASAYNVQWRGARPVFIDVGSFEVHEPGSPWVGYLQFCQLFLFPLLLTAYRGLPFGPWLRGAIDGITPEDCNRVFSLRDRFRPGVFTDVYLQARLQARNARTEASLRSDLRRAGFKKELIVHNVRRLQKIVRGLAWRQETSEWAAYVRESSYGREDQEIKERFVGEVAAGRRWRLVWDLGCNTGVFSRIAAAHADGVVAIDGDPLAVDLFYRDLRESGPDNVLPLVNNLADPSPALGWRHRERRALTERPRPELTLCLALIHHLVLTANVPLPELVDWLADLGSSLVIEFVDKADPMVQQLLRNKPDVYEDYDPAVFERCLEERFEVARRQTFHGGTRTLYFARPR